MRELQSQRVSNRGDSQTRKIKVPLQQASVAEDFLSSQLEENLSSAEERLPQANISISQGEHSHSRS